MPPNVSNLPKDHPFRMFLFRLTADPVCDPMPDFIEVVNDSRCIAAFNGTNFSARMCRFTSAIANDRSCCAGVMKCSYHRDSGVVVFYLYKAPSPGQLCLLPAPSVEEILRRSPDPRQWEDVEDDYSPPPEKKPETPLPGVRMMPSY